VTGVYSIVCMSDSVECEVALRTLAGSPTRYCACPMDVLAAIRAAPLPPAILWDLEGARCRAVVAAVLASRAANASLRHLFRVSLRPEVTQALCSLLAGSG
jgi:hypothetical protein